MHSILIIQSKFLGDLVLTAALVRNLRQHYPGVRIVVLCSVGFDQFLLAHGIADATVTFRKSVMRGPPLGRVREMYRMVTELRRHRCDMSIDLTDSKTTRVIIRLVNARVRIGFKPTELPMRRWEYQPNNLGAPGFGRTGTHFLDVYLSPLEALNLERLTQYPSIAPLPHESERARALLSQAGLQPGKFIVVHAGSSFVGRSWQPERFAAAMDRIAAARGLPFLIIGGPAETELADSIIRSTSCGAVNFAGAFPLETSLAILKEARLFLGNESGPMHLAAATGTPVVGLYGLTDPERWGPVGASSLTVRPSMPCPCVAKHLCKFPDPSKCCCVWRLDPESVVDAVCRLLDRTENAPRAEAPAGPGTLSIS